MFDHLTVSGKKGKEPTESKKEELFEFRATSLISIQMVLSASWHLHIDLRATSSYMFIIWQDVVLKSILTGILIKMIPTKSLTSRY